MTLGEIPTVAHHLMASLFQTIHRMIMKHPQNGSSKGISTLLLVTALGLEVPPSFCHHSLLVSSSWTAPGGQPPFESLQQKFCYF